MRISFNPSVTNTSPIAPVRRVVRRTPSPTSEPVEPETVNTAPVITSVSELAANRPRDEAVEEKEYKKRNPLWNTMHNLR